MSQHEKHKKIEKTCWLGQIGQPSSHNGQCKGCWTWSSTHRSPLSWPGHSSGLGEDAGILEKFEGGINQWEEVEVFKLDLIQTPVINAGSEVLVFFFHKEESYPRKWSGWMDESFSEQLCNVPLHGLPLWVREGVESPSLLVENDAPCSLRTRGHYDRKEWQVDGLPS